MSRRLPSGRALNVTPRQRQILDLAVRGLTDKEIAADLGVAVSTIRTHLERFYRENGLRNKTGAVAVWQHYRDAERQQQKRSE
jgi:DNA-binding CsgD family transcriptional regulator